MKRSLPKSPNVLQAVGDPLHPKTHENLTLGEDFS